MLLYIGNTTRQIVDFAYRVERGGSLRQQRIDPGTQQQLAGHLTSDQVTYVVDDHRRYGMIAEDEVSRTRSFHGMCFAVDKPITAAKLTYIMTKNMDVLVQTGENIRRANAVAQNSIIDTALKEAGRPERVASLDLTMQQEREDPNNDVPQFSKGIHVTSTSHGQAPRGRGKRRAA